MIPHNIGVTVVYPPDTDTPGLARENESKPEATKKISELDGIYSAQTVAEGIWDGVRRGKERIGFGVNGYMLNHLTVGMLPAEDHSQLFADIFFWPLFRLIAHAHALYFDSICRKFQKSVKTRSTLKTNDV